MSAVYSVWRTYQRRAETLAPRLSATLLYFPHFFHSRWLRPLDYFIHFLSMIRLLSASRPSIVFVQSPPVHAALAPLVLRIPYVIDAHNTVFQAFWGRLPLSDWILRKARAVIVHNEEIESLARQRLPVSQLFTIPDPIAPIRWPVSREAKRVLFVCSFDPGEPVELIAEIVESLNDYQFYITADTKKLSRSERARFRTLSNLTLTGFLSTEAYQRLLCSSTAAVVLEESESQQPSGACEAMSSDTPLVLSCSTLTRKLFGDWAWLVENRAEQVTGAIRKAAVQRLDLTSQRERWNATVDAGLAELLKKVSGGRAVASELHRSAD